MGREIELKLVLPRTALAALRRHPIVAGAERLASATLDNTYYDTKALALKKNGIGLRTRRYKNTTLQTVKCAAASIGGLSQRPEWEQPYTGSFDFSGIDDSRTLKHLSRHQGDLIPAFSTRFKRETRRYAPDEDVSILLMLDTGEIICCEQRESLCELELELERGTPLDLLTLASRLAADLPLLPSDVSKAERGYRLLEGYPTAPSLPRPIPLSKHHTSIGAFKALALDYLRQWQSSVEEASSAHTPGTIHGLRIAHRRLRTLIKVFSPALPAGFARTWNARLGENARQFSSVRDLDVLCDDILAPVTGYSDDEIAALSRLRTVSSDAREAAHRNAQEALDPVVQGRLVLAFMVALHTLPELAPDQSADLRTFGQQSITHLRKRARRSFRHALDLTPAHLHILRIAIKQLRYGAELFSPFQGKRTARDTAKTLIKAQRLLGYVCDFDIAHHTLTALADSDVQLQQAAAFVRGWHARRYDRAGRKALRCAETLLRGNAMRRT